MPKVKQSYSLVYGSSKKGTEDEEIITIPVMTTGGNVPTKKKLDNILKKPIRLSGCDVGRPDVIIITNKERLDEGIEIMSNDRDEAKATFLITWKAIKNADVDKIYEEQGDEWNKYACMLVDHYCARFVLFNKSMPVLEY